MTGLLVYGIGIVSLGQSFDAGAALLSIGIATLYVALMGSFMSLVDHWVSRRVPLARSAPSPCIPSRRP